jgi:hypothetical protein
VSSTDAAEAVAMRMAAPYGGLEAGEPVVLAVAARFGDGGLLPEDLSVSMRRFQEGLLPVDVALGDGFLHCLPGAAESPGLDGLCRATRALLFELPPSLRLLHIQNLLHVGRHVLADVGPGEELRRVILIRVGPLLPKLGKRINLLALESLECPGPPGGELGKRINLLALESLECRGAKLRELCAVELIRRHTSGDLLSLADVLRHNPRCLR